MTQYDYGSTQFDLPEDVAGIIRSFGQTDISDSDLFVDRAQGIEGRESDIHVTVLYGLGKNVTPSGVTDIVAGFGPVSLVLDETSLFTNAPDYDVLKIDVASSALLLLHNRLREQLGAPGNRFPHYQPHITIAYLKKGRGHHYLTGRYFKGMQVKVSTLQFSGSDGLKTPISLTSTAKSLRIDHNLSRAEATSVAVGLALNDGDAGAVIEALAKADAFDEGPVYAGEAARVAQMGGDIDQTLNALVAAGTGLLQEPLALGRLDPTALWWLTTVLRSRAEEVLLRNTDALVSLGLDLDEPALPTSLPFPLRSVEEAFADGAGVLPVQQGRANALERVVLPRTQIDAQALIDERLANLPQALLEVASPILHSAGRGEPVRWDKLAAACRKLFGFDDDWDRFAHTSVRFAYTAGQLSTLQDEYVRVVVSAKACHDCKRLLDGVTLKTVDLWRTLVETRGYQPRGRQNWKPMIPCHPRCGCVCVGLSR